MPLSIIISPNKKIGVPFKKELTIKGLINEVIKRANLPNDQEYKLEYQNAELYECDTLEDLGLTDSIELVLIYPSSDIVNSNSNTAESNNVAVSPLAENLSIDDLNQKFNTNTNINNNPTTTTETTTNNNNNNNNNNNDNNNNNNNNNNDNSKVSIYESEVNQIDVICLDLSGSMKGSAFKGSRVPGELEMSRIELSQTLFQTFIDKLISLEVAVATGLVTFGERVELTFGITRNFDSFSTELGEVVANQSKTRLFDAIQLAAETIVKFKENPTGGIKLSPNALCRVFCLTDGEDNSGVNPYPVYQYMKKHNIVLDSIPIGLDGVQKLSSFSNSTGGSSFIADSSLEAVELFEREALLSLAARDNFKPFSMKILNSFEFHGVAGTVKRTVERKVEPVFKNVKLQSTIDTSPAAEMKFFGTGKRIFSEYKDFKDKELSKLDQEFYVFLDANNIFAWNIIMKGPKYTPYSEGYFTLSINFPNDYPIKPPKVRFLTKIYHCNINNDGNICISSLKDTWSPALTIHRIMHDISMILVKPCPDDPLDVVKAGVYRDAVSVYNKNAGEWCKRYSSDSLEETKKIYRLMD